MDMNILNKINEIVAKGRKLSPEDREVKYNIIIQFRNSGLTWREIGDYFNCSQTTIRLFKRNFENPEKSREYSRKWRAENPDKHRESNRKSCRKWRAENPEKARESSRKWRAENPEKARDYSRNSYRKWRAENPEKARESSRMSTYNRGVRIADNFTCYEDLSEEDKKFIDRSNDTDRIKETDLQYLRLKLNTLGYERHHIIPHKTCVHYYKLTGDTYYRDLTWKEDNIYELTPEDHNKLHSKLYEFGYGREAIVPEEDWDEYRELVINLIEDKNQSSLDDF